MLAGRGFKKVINLAGGFKAWNGERAFFGEEKGLELFSGNEETDKTLVVAYAMEEGLRVFYTSWSEKIENDAVEMVKREIAAEFKERELKVVKDGNVFKIYGDLSLGKI